MAEAFDSASAFLATAVRVLSPEELANTMADEPEAYGMLVSHTSALGVLRKLAESARAGRFSVAVRPADGEVLWDVPGRDQPDENGNCKCCGRRLDDEDEHDD
jgi:hypothetical protein